MRTTFTVLFLSLAVTANAAIDRASADKAFAELDAMCKRDKGSLWGESICGPTLLVNPTTREFVTNDPERPSGKLPESVGIANTAVDFEGKRWTMVMLPLPTNDFERQSLLAHESFHRVQDKLGFASTGPSNAHLDTVEGRALLRLELRALATAIRGGDTGVRDALLFRARRHQLFPEAAAEERELEMHEGLAEYTGTRLAAPSIAERPSKVLEKLKKAEERPTFVRSFAYDTIPAWGLLLERRNRNWTRSVKSSADVPSLVAHEYGVTISGDLAALVDLRAPAYGGTKIFEEERARGEKRVAEQQAIRARYVEGPTLILPLAQSQMQFDPNRLRPVEGVGTVYDALTISDAWGKLIADSALISSDFTRVVVPAPAADSPLRGDGWTLALNDGWSVARGDDGWRVRKAE